MKTFKDLKFKPHPVSDGLQAVECFNNGYGVSVVRFKIPIIHEGDIVYGTYTNNENEWEVAVIKGNTDSWAITYDTSVTDDVIGHCLESYVTEIMKKVQELDVLCNEVKI